MLYCAIYETRALSTVTGSARARLYTSRGLGFASGMAVAVPLNHKASHSVGARWAGGWGAVGWKVGDGERFIPKSFQWREVDVRGSLSS